MRNGFRNGAMVLGIALCSITSAAAQISIGINIPVYPQLVAVPDYPVYYAPQLDSNYFFYDGAYWAYDRDNWYASSWYNGPWALVTPDAVPLFILRVPVRYYRRPPAYFHGWNSEAPPQWGQHWGNDWQQSHNGWDNWNRGSVPAPAPLPAYQRQYSGNRYPSADQQQVLQTQNYHYQPREAVVRQQTRQAQPAPAQQSQGVAAVRNAPRPAAQNVPQPPPSQAQEKPAGRQGQQAQQAAAQRGQMAPNAQAQDRTAARPVPQPPQAAAAQRGQQAPNAQAQDKSGGQQAQQRQQAATQHAQAPRPPVQDKTAGQPAPQKPQAQVQRARQPPAAQRQDNAAAHQPQPQVAAPREPAPKEAPQGKLPEPKQG